MVKQLKQPKRYSLIQQPTPIQPARTLGRSHNVQIFFKRDDRTGLLTSGNKIRKLEFLIYEGLSKGADCFVTWGANQSNHARATAAVCARLGLQCVLLLRGKPTEHIQGNLFLDYLLGAKPFFLSPEEYQNVDQIAHSLAQQLLRKGKTPYLIPEGGSSPLGAWGYIQMVRELRAQMKRHRLVFDSVICAVGSGGTYAGLLLGKKLLGLKARIYGINVCRDRPYFKKKIGDIAREAIQRYRLPIQIKPNDINIIEGYVGLGYAVTQKKELESLVHIARQEGIILDPVYTNKAMYGLLDQIRKNKSRFGKRILFLHSGGVYGLFPAAKEISRVLNNLGPSPLSREPWTT